MSKPISFRINSQEVAKLEILATKAGLSRTQYARKILLEHLNDMELNQVKMKITALSTEVAGLKEGLANGMEAMLIAVGKVDKDEAQEWVNDKIRMK